MIQLIISSWKIVAAAFFLHGEVIHHGCIMASIANQLYTIWLDMLRMCMYIMYNALQGKLRYPRIHV